MPCKMQVTAKQAAHLFFQFVWVHFGLLASIVYGRNSHFLEEFWTSLWRMTNTKFKRSMKFHPQINRQIEVANRIVIHLL